MMRGFKRQEVLEEIEAIKKFDANVYKKLLQTFRYLFELEKEVLTLRKQLSEYEQVDLFDRMAK